MKLFNIRKTNKTLLLSSASALVVVSAIGVGVYAMQPKNTDSQKKDPVSSVETRSKVESVTTETTPVIEADPVTQPAVIAPESNNSNVEPSVAPTNNEDAELTKRCELVNLTIDHIKTSITARGHAATEEEILRELSINPRNQLANTYYQECVAAGKTPTL